MKILLSILLLVFGVTTSFAQSSTPDYIQKAKVGLNQYYPQFKDYFEPIFARIDMLDNNLTILINQEIHENFEIFDDELTTERDKCATILTVLEDLLERETFKDSKKQVDSSAGEELINGIAIEIAGDVNVQIRKKIREEKEELAKLEIRTANAKEILNLMNNSTKSREAIERISIMIEDYYKLFEICEIKDDSALQRMIRVNIDFNKQINRHPNAIGKKFIDEYNRITKSK